MSSDLLIFHNVRWGGLLYLVGVEWPEDRKHRDERISAEFLVQLMVFRLLRFAWLRHIGPVWILPWGPKYLSHSEFEVYILMPKFVYALQLFFVKRVGEWIDSLPYWVVELERKLQSRVRRTGS